MTYQMIRTLIFVVVLQLASALLEEKTEHCDCWSNMTGTSVLGSSPLLTCDYITVSQPVLPSETDLRGIQELIKILKWYHIIVLYYGAYNEGDDNLQFLSPDLGLTSVYDLGGLHHSDEVKQVLQQLYNKFFPKLNFLLLSNYSMALHFLQMVDQYDLESNRTTEFRHHSFWLVACNRPCQPEIGVLCPLQHMENVVLIVSQKDGSSRVLQLITIPGGRSFSQMKELKGMKEGDIFPNRKYGLNNRKLTVSTMTNSGGTMVMKKGNSFEGFAIDVLDSIAFALNFSYEIVHRRDVTWGKMVDGRWDGLVGQLERREVDLVVAGLAIHEDRDKVMDFLYPSILSMVYDIMYHLEPEETTKGHIYLRPISTFFFITLSVTLVASTVVGYTLQRCDELFTRQDRINCGRKRRMLSLADTFFYMFGIVIIRGLESNPKILSARLFFFTWGVFSVIIAACYTANLVASFANQKPTLPFTSLGELVRQKEYKWGFLGGDIKEHIFNQSKSGDMKLAWDGVVQFNKTDPDVLSPQNAVHLAKVKMEKYAMITDENTIAKMKRSDCNIHQVGQNIIWKQFSFGVPTDYPLKKELESVLGAVLDSGLIDIWWQRWDKIETDKCTKNRSVDNLTFVEVSWMFFLLGVGFGAAGVVLAGEVIINMLNNPHRGPVI